MRFDLFVTSDDEKVLMQYNQCGSKKGLRDCYEIEVNYFNKATEAALKAIIEAIPQNARRIAVVLDILDVCIEKVKEDIIIRSFDEKLDTTVEELVEE